VGMACVAMSMPMPMPVSMIVIMDVRMGHRGQL